MKTIIFFPILLSILLLMGCASTLRPVEVFNNNYSDFLALKDKMEMDDPINSFMFSKTYRYEMLSKTHGRITIDDKKKIYLISDSYPYNKNIYYSSKEDLFSDLGINFDALLDYLLFFEKYHRSFWSIGAYKQTISYDEIPAENLHYFSQEAIENIERENSFLKKLNKARMTYRFVSFDENIGFAILGGGPEICYSPDIDLSELSREESLIFGFKRVEETAHKNWYEVWR